MRLYEEDKQVAEQEVQQFLGDLKMPKWIQKSRDWILSKVFKIKVDKNNPEKTVEQILQKLQDLTGASDVTDADPITEAYKYHNAINLVTDPLTEEWALEMDFISNNLDRIHEYMELYPEAIEKVVRIQESLPWKTIGKQIMRMAIPILLITVASLLGPTPMLLARFAMPLYGIIKAIGGAKKAAQVASQAAAPAVEQKVQQAAQTTETPAVSATTNSSFFQQVSSNKWQQFFLGVPDSKVLQDWYSQQKSNPSIQQYVQLGLKLMQADLQNAKDLAAGVRDRFTRSVQWLGSTT